MFKEFIKWVFKSLGLRKYDIRDERPSPIVVEKDAGGVAEEHYLLTSKAKAKKPAAKKPAKKSKVAPKITATKGKQKVK